jgi:hypothetical protein
MELANSGDLKTLIGNTDVSMQQKHDLITGILKPNMYKNIISVQQSRDRCPKLPHDMR